MTPETEREVIEFIQWLTPCGEVEPGPTLELIGKTARELNKKMILDAVFTQIE